MKTTFNRRTALLALASLALCGTVHAQKKEKEQPKVGFLRLINSVGQGTGNTKLTIDGEDMFPKGYKLGQRTGGIGLPAGSKKITVSKEGVVEGTTTLSVEDGETMNMVAFAERVPAKDDKPEHFEIKLMLLKQRDVEKGYRLTVLSVSEQLETLFEVKREGAKEKAPNSVKRLMTTSIDLGSHAGDVGVFLRDQPESLAFFRPDSPGNYVVVFYDDPEGKVKALFFYDPKFVIAG
ncbi:hypothetical protein [Haloferula sp. BvORR071]|uniref:hypothetical protein n=1 Tax=Haloferula sp. BvORR071 TaxID=1396141 RepID=UPI00055781AF|nr:hypothetical protein [Haloferula sp. BvORR071]